MGGRNLATYPRCPKCHRKRDVARFPRAWPPWYCQPCDLNFYVRLGFSTVDDSDLPPYPSDIKPACKPQGLGVAHDPT